MNSIYGKQSTAAPGEMNGNAKLNNEKVKAIKWSKGKITQRELADIYDVDRTTIARIQTGKIWSHIKI